MELSDYKNGSRFTHRYGVMNVMSFVIEVAAKIATGRSSTEILRLIVTNIVRTSWFTWALRIAEFSSFIPSSTPSKPSFDPNQKVPNSSREFVFVIQ
jgi:hypothetical protein